MFTNELVPSLGVCWSRRRVIAMMLLSILPLFLLLHLQSDLTSAADDSHNPNLLRAVKEKKKMPTKEDLKRRCQSQGPCYNLPAECLSCRFNLSCVYGEEVATECQPVAGVMCEVSQVNELPQ